MIPYHEIPHDNAEHITVVSQRPRSLRVLPQIGSALAFAGFVLVGITPFVAIALGIRSLKTSPEPHSEERRSAVIAVVVGGLSLLWSILFFWALAVQNVGGGGEPEGNAFAAHVSWFACGATLGIGAWVLSALAGRARRAVEGSQARLLALHAGALFVIVGTLLAALKFLHLANYPRYSGGLIVRLGPTDLDYILLAVGLVILTLGVLMTYGLLRRPGSQPFSEDVSSRH